MSTPVARHPITVLVHRPGRTIALATAATLTIGVILVLGFQWSGGTQRGGLNLLLLIPAIIGFVAVMRTGTTRCDVLIDERELTVRSVDSSQLLGRTREVSYAWTEILRAGWVGDDNDELRLDFNARPRALVFSGARRDLEALHEAASGRR